MGPSLRWKIWELHHNKGPGNTPHARSARHGRDCILSTLRAPEHEQSHLHIAHGALCASLFIASHPPPTTTTVHSIGGFTCVNFTPRTSHLEPLAHVDDALHKHGPVSTLEHAPHDRRGHRNGAEDRDDDPDPIVLVVPACTGPHPVGFAPTRAKSCGVPYGKFIHAGFTQSWLHTNVGPEWW